MNQIIKNKFFSNKLTNKSFFGPFVFLFLSILILLIFTNFYPIITDNEGGAIGVGAKILNIGDRNFYLSSNNEIYRDIKPSFLYPLVLNLIKDFVGLWGYDQYSKLWNFLVIVLSSILSLTSLILICDTAWELFGSKVAKISGWIYVLCPYTTFFVLSGSLTNYVFLGTTFCFWTLSKSELFITKNKIKKPLSPFQTILILSFTGIYLSFLRPTGAIFNILFLSLIIINLKLRFFANSKEKFLSIFFLCISIAISFYELKISSSYIDFSLRIFQNEKGNFFGVKREIMRNRLFIGSELIFDKLKNILLIALWKVSDFFSGLNDIRDTHTIFTYENSPPLTPFILRVFTGIFYFAPINILALLGFVKSRKIIFIHKFWIFFVSIFISLSPSIIGVASNRYLFMFYSPFIIFSAIVLSDI